MDTGWTLDGHWMRSKKGVCCVAFAHEGGLGGSDDFFPTQCPERGNHCRLACLYRGMRVSIIDKSAGTSHCTRAFIFADRIRPTFHARTYLDCQNCHY